MEQHIKIVGVLSIVWGAMGAPAGLIVLLVFGGVAGIVGSVTRHEPDAAMALPEVRQDLHHASDELIANIAALGERFRLYRANHRQLHLDKIQEAVGKA